jgi:hypothetical protein
MGGSWFCAEEHAALNATNNASRAPPRIISRMFRGYSGGPERPFDGSFNGSVRSTSRAAPTAPATFAHRTTRPRALHGFGRWTLQI